MKASRSVFENHDRMRRRIAPDRALDCITGNHAEALTPNCRTKPQTSRLALTKVQCPKELPAPGTPPTRAEARTSEPRRSMLGHPGVRVAHQGSYVDEVLRSLLTNSTETPHHFRAALPE